MKEPRLGLIGLIGLPMVAIIVAAIVAGGALGSGCDKSRADSVKLVNEGFYAFDRGEREAAYSYFRRATRVDPKNHRAYYEMALMDLYDNDQEQKGIAALETAEKLEPRDRDVLFQLGRAHLKAKHFDVGLRYLQRAVDIDPGYAPAWYFKGVALVETDKAADADMAFREAIACDPTYTQAFRDLGMMYERFEHDDVALAVYAEGLKHTDAAPDLLNNTGMLQMRQGKIDEAIKSFDRAVTIGGGRTDAIFNLAFAYVEKGNTRMAYRYLGEFINVAPETDKENIAVASRLREAMLNTLRRDKDEAAAKALEASDK